MARPSSMLVVDHPDRQRLGVAAGVARGAQLGEPGPVGQGRRRGGVSCSASPATTGPLPSPRPVTTAGTRRTRGRRAPPCPAPADRPARRPACSPPSCRRRLRRRTRRGCRTRQRHHPGLRERRTLTLVHPGPPEPRVVLRRCRRHPDTSRRSPSTAAPPATPPASTRLANGAATRRNNASTGSDPNRARAWKIADFDGNSTAAATRRPRQPVGQQRQHVLIGALGVQRHPDREVRHHPRRQRPMPLLGTTRPGDHLINQRRRERPRQHPHRHQIRQPTLRLRLPPSSTRHPTKLHRCSLN